MADAKIEAVVGLDLSLTRTGLAVLDTQPIPGPTGVGTQLGSWVTAAVRCPSGVEATRSGQMSEPYMDMAEEVFNAGFHELNALHIPSRRTLWVIEGYAVVPGRGDGPALAGELTGLVKSMLHRYEELYIAIPPSRIKKFATGRGDAAKDQMRLGVYKNWGVEAKTIDEIDAFAAARLGATALGWFEATNQAQREVVFEVRKQLRGLGLEVPGDPAEAKKQGRAKAG